MGIYFTEAFEVKQWEYCQITHLFCLDFASVVWRTSLYRRTSMQTLHQGYSQRLYTWFLSQVLQSEHCEFVYMYIYSNIQVYPGIVDQNTHTGQLLNRAKIGPVPDILMLSTMPKGQNEVRQKRKRTWISMGSNIRTRKRGLAINLMIPGMYLLPFSSRSEWLSWH